MGVFVRHKWLWLALIITCLVIIVIFSIIQPWSGPLSPREVLAQASSPEIIIQSYRMKYLSEEIEGDTTKVTNGEAAYASPETFRLMLSIGDWVRNYINIGEIQYEKETGTAVDTKGQTIFFSTYIPNIETTISVLEQLIDIEALKDEEINNILCYHFRGQYDAPAIEDMLANIKNQLPEEEFQQIKERLVNNQEKTTADFWISKDDYLVCRLQNVTSTQGKGIVYTETLTYYDFNRPITITAPLDEEGSLLSGWHISNPQITSPQ